MASCSTAPMHKTWGPSLIWSQQGQQGLTSCSRALVSIPLRHRLVLGAHNNCFGAGQLQLFSGMQCALPAPCCLGMLCEHGDRPLQLLLYPLDFVAVSAV